MLPLSASARVILSLKGVSNKALIGCNQAIGSAGLIVADLDFFLPKMLPLMTSQSTSSADIALDQLDRA
ncbi:MAG: hypothetical protein PVI42_13330, partial [Desulfobacterales bacterium]